MRIHARLARALVLAASLASLGACSTWSRRPIPAPGRDDFLPVARVTRADGVPFVLDNVTVGRDSVIGRKQAEPRARVALPIADVRMVEARRPDPLATVAVVALSVGAAFAAWAALVIRVVGTGS